MKNNNIILLVLGGLLISYGLLGPIIQSNINTNHNRVVVVNVESPLDPSLKKDCEKVIDALKNGSADRNVDGVKLSSLYADLAKLISLDETNEVIKNTDEIRDANRLAGLLYDLNLKGKYPDLVSAANSAVINYVGDDNVVLDKNLRKKAVEAFNGLSWAFYEGSK